MKYGGEEEEEGGGDVVVGMDDVDAAALDSSRPTRGVTYPGGGTSANPRGVLAEGAPEGLVPGGGTP